MANEFVPLDESTLVAILESEEQDAVGYYDDELSSDQENALKYYFGEPFGDEIEGRSAVVSKDVRETVEWITPDLARIFMQGDVVECEPDDEGAVKHAKQATHYLNHVFHRDNPGFSLWQSWAKDGLIQKLGVFKIEWKEPDWLPVETHKNLPTVRLAPMLAMQDEDKFQILKHEERECEASDDYPDGICHDVKVRRLEPYGKPVIKVIAPENFLVKRGTAQIDESGYRSDWEMRSIGSLIEQFPDKKEIIANEMPADGGEDYWEERKQTRFQDQEYRDETSRTPTDFASRQVRFLDEYIEVDFDGDGIPELRNVKRVGRLVLFNEEVDEDPYADWCPIHVAHKLHGLSIADETMDIQRIKSVVWRATLDSMYQAVSPRMAVNTDAVNVNDLLTNRPGQSVRCDGIDDVRKAIMPLVVPDLSASGYQMLEYVDQESEGRTGISRYAQGMDPDSLNKTATGIQLLQNASNGRKEMIARNMAFGLEKLFNKLLRMLMRYESSARTIKIGDGKWESMEPFRWSSEMHMQVHVGLGTGSREAQMGLMSNILSIQERIIAGAPDSGIVQPDDIYRAVSKLTELAGYKEKFFSDPAQQPPQEPQPDPEVQKAQIQAQAEQQKAQMQMAMEQYKADVQREMDQAKAALEGELKAAEIQADREAALLKYQEEMQQLQAELGLKWQMFLAELEMKREFHQEEMSLKREQGVMAEQGKIEQARIKTDVHTGGEPG